MNYILNYMYQVSDGMHYLHEKQIVHRDLALRNILIMSKYMCKISDFGLSRVIAANNYYVVSRGKFSFSMKITRSFSFTLDWTKSSFTIHMVSTGSIRNTFVSLTNRYLVIWGNDVGSNILRSNTLQAGQTDGLYSTVSVTIRNISRSWRQ